MSVFESLNKINVNEHTEKKGNLTYLSWAWAWGELLKVYPDATYKVYENDAGWNYHTDGRTAWVKTGVTVEGKENIEMLPVMDFRNNSIPLEKVTSMDVNKAIQRSLTKAVARHGLGLYIYAGEDLPEGCEEPEKEPVKVKMPDIPKTDAPAQIVEEKKLPFDAGREIRAYLVENNISIADFKPMYKALIDGGVVRDIKQADMGPDDVENLKTALRLNFSGVCK